MCIITRHHRILARISFTIMSMATLLDAPLGTMTSAYLRTRVRPRMSSEHEHTVSEVSNERPVGGQWTRRPRTKYQQAKVGEASSLLIEWTRVAVSAHVLFRWQAIGIEARLDGSFVLLQDLLNTPSAFYEVAADAPRQPRVGILPGVWVGDEMVGITSERRRRRERAGECARRRCNVCADAMGGTVASVDAKCI